MEYDIKLFEEKYRKQVEEQAYYSCVSILEEDFKSMFVLLKKGKFMGFGFLRFYDDYAELNGPYFKEFVPEKDYKEIMDRILRAIKKRFPELKIYFLTDYPEYFENRGCKVAFDAPPQILLKAAPT